MLAGESCAVFDRLPLVTTDLQIDREHDPAGCAGCDAVGTDKIKFCQDPSGSTITVKFVSGLYHLRSVQLTDNAGNLLDVSRLDTSYHLDYTAATPGSFTTIENAFSNIVSRFRSC